ncbi:MAG: class I SAM-dependent methyltransferase [Mycobacterium sp.]
MARTDGDSWDLLSGVGTTALGVAAARAHASGRPDALITDPYARPLIEALGVDYYLRMADGDLGDDDPAAGLDLSLVADGMAIRTQFFDEFFSDACAAGIRQAVILASGLDTRAYRLPWPAGTSVFELDQPGVIDFKVAAMAGIGVVPDVPVHSIGVDLRDDWPKALRDNGFDPAESTAWIAEGLLGYLPPDAQDRLFDAITVLSAVGSRVVTDWHPDFGVTTNDRSREVTKFERERSNGVDIEDVSEMIYLGERHDVGDYLQNLGWEIATQTAESRFAANGMLFRRDDSISGLVDAYYTSAVLA